MHIAVILDGNRRYAKQRRLSPWEGHSIGVQRVEELLRWCKELGVKELTLYVFSMENFKRSEKEIKYLYKLFISEFEKFVSTDELEKNRAKFRFFGRTKLFPGRIQDIMKELIEKSNVYDDLVCNVAMAYGGRQEIIDAVNRIIKDKVDHVDENSFSKYLYTNREPDILIRTGGEMRLSNFLIWQTNYSELFFINKMWPEFTKQDLVDIIEEYQTRQRRFGK